jgi:hemin uptake protein HemP
MKSNSGKQNKPEVSARSARPEDGGSQRVSSRQLLGGSNELIIDHQGREYRLRLTQNGKLILTA